MTLNLGIPESGSDRALIKYDAARAALAEAHALDEVKEIRDKAEAVRLYARQAQDLEMQRWVAEIKLRAERRAGELLIQMAASGAREDGPGRPEKTSQAATLKDLGITRDQSARWQAEAGLPEADFESWLARHTGETMPSSSGLRALIKVRAARERHVATAGCTVNDLEALAFERPGEFTAILVDVPSKYKTFSEAGASRSPDMHYPTMTVDELIAMGPIVRALAAKDCALFYWTSGPHLENAFRILAAWADGGGAPVFRYSTRAFCWVKTLPPAGAGWFKGNGHWTRANPEDCLLFLKGHPARLSANVDELVIAPRGAHSAKPEAVHEGIEALVAGPYVELFARAPRDGWAVWGNEVVRASGDRPSPADDEERQGSAP